MADNPDGYFIKKIKRLLHTFHLRGSAGNHVPGSILDSDNTVLLHSNKFGTLFYRCNICGNACETPIAEINRENASCPRCSSSLRMRSIIHLLSVELFGRSLALPDFPVRPDITGIGLSDWEGYAVPLSHKLNYRNTYYHTEPKLDITGIDQSLEGTLDFLISSDVFEHIPPPVSVAFENACRLLKPDGIFIFTVPYAAYGETIEYFAELHNYEIIEQKGAYILKNITKDGREQIFENLTFHGGPGSTLEMRIFSESSLMEDLESAGFHYVTSQRDPHFEHGIYWDIECVPIVARKNLPFRSVLQTLTLHEETNNISFHVDRLTQRSKTIEIKGWAYLNKENTENMEIYMVLKSARNTYTYNTAKIQRPDVTAHFKALDLDNSGFHSIIPKDEIEKDKYRIGLFIRKDFIHGLQYTGISLTV